MTPMESLRCGTLNGAKYLGLDKDLGSLEGGKLADMIVIEKGFDPTKEIRDSDDIQYVVTNGRVFDAKRMNELGSPEPRKPFYWEQQGYGGVSVALPRASGCGCQRPGAAF
jgi:cytosine/adenosine deaminase-related metal-dependent hydrolase